jgi:nucleoside-diphosphate-sugar epimerase
MPNQDHPASFADDAELNEYMSRPTPDLIDALGRLGGDLVLLGIAGKMGVTMGMLAVRALRAAGSRARVIGVSRFSEAGSREVLERAGVATIQCDLLDPDAVARLPDASDVIFLAGRKFGTSGGGEALTWAMNAIAPAHAARRYRGSRIVALSTGCVYPQVEGATGGCREDDAVGPVGEYAMSTLARERVFEHASRSEGTPVCLVRLNYSLDLRYGVIHDIARQVIAGEPVDVSTPLFNGVWQGDANRMVLRCLEHCATPAAVLNVTGPETLSVAHVATDLGRQLGKPVSFAGVPAARQWLNDAGRAIDLFGYPAVSPATVLRWTGAWMAGGGRSLGKPTHFAASDGRF